MLLEHTGNQNRSDEEVGAIVEILAELTNGSHRWSNKSGILESVTLEDVLIVAPYNAQIDALQRALPASARVGTVDKFQGQEAPIVIYSMTSSSAVDAPRVIFNRNRMNVATSRARSLVILVCSSKLCETVCMTVEEMRLVNGFSRYLELAKKVSV